MSQINQRAEQTSDVPVRKRTRKNKRGRQRDARRREQGLLVAVDPTVGYVESVRGDRKSLCAAAPAAQVKPMPRVGAGGPDHFTPGAMVRMAGGSVPFETVATGLVDVAFMARVLGASRGDLAELAGVSAWTWVRVVNSDTPETSVTPAFDPVRNVYHPSEVGLVRVGFTGGRVARSGVVGPADVEAVLFTLRTVGAGGTVDEAAQAVAQAVPVAVRSMSWTDPKIDVGATPLFAADEVGFAAVAGQLLFNLVDVLRRTPHGATPGYGGGRLAAPELVVLVDGPQGPDGAPQYSVSVDFVEAMTALLSGGPPPAGGVDVVRMGDLRFSFAGLGPVSWDYELQPTTGVAPWTVGPGNVLEASGHINGIRLVMPDGV